MPRWTIAGFAAIIAAIIMALGGSSAHLAASELTTELTAELTAELTTELTLEDYQWQDDPYWSRYQQGALDTASKLSLTLSYQTAGNNPPSIHPFDGLPFDGQPIDGDKSSPELHHAISWVAMSNAPKILCIARGFTTFRNNHFCPKIRDVNPDTLFIEVEIGYGAGRSRSALAKLFQLTKDINHIIVLEHTILDAVLAGLHEAEPGISAKKILVLGWDESIEKALYDGRIDAAIDDRPYARGVFIVHYLAHRAGFPAASPGLALPKAVLHTAGQ